MLLAGARGPAPDWDDAALVLACLDGSEAAWGALVEKYRRLIMSVPVRFRLSREEAEDIFQAVFVELIQHLDRIREPAALRGWLVRVATHKCLRSRTRIGREEATDPTTMATSIVVEPEVEDLMREVEQQEEVRQGLRTLSEQCRRLLEMLFREEPARPYDEVATVLGVKRGSVNFLRSRCLHRLRKALPSLGL